MRGPIFLAMALILAASSSAQTRAGPEPVVGDKELGPAMDPPGPGAGGDDDPRIDASEVVEPSRSSAEEAWVPAYEWHSGETGEGRGPDSLECGGRTACESYKDNRTVER